MKNIQHLILEKHNDAQKYEKIGNGIYRDLAEGAFKTTLMCELEEGEDSQYPLEDILDLYEVNCTDYIEERMSGDTSLLLVELESSLGDTDSDLANIQKVAQLVGKRVYHKKEGNSVKLMIE